MSSVSENNKRIAKNTLFLYARLLFAMAVGLYTSQVVLATLGADDFGLNAVVTSAVAIFYFINYSMAGATSRFLTFELGKGDTEKLRKTFSAALTIHVLIALLVLVLGETIGLWYLENKMVIPEGRMTAARWVYQLSLASAMLIITQVPYSAILIARERMNVYAYIEILKTSLLLGIVYLLVVGSLDKLVLYAVLTLLVTLVTTSVYRLYCTRHFEESRYKFHWDRETIRPMLSFSIWNLFGNLGVTLKYQGVNVVLNLFFATAINAAFGLASQVQSAIANVASNFMLAVNPQIIKYYAENKIIEMQNLMINATKYTFLLTFAVCLPLILEIDFILALWLKDVPAYTDIFCQLFLVTILFIAFQRDLIYAIHATEKIKSLALSEGIVNTLIPVLSYIFFKAGNREPYIPLLVMITMNIMLVVISLCIVRSLIARFSIRDFVRRTVCVVLPVVVLVSIIPLLSRCTLTEGWTRLVLVTLTSTICTAIATCCIVMNKQTREKIRAYAARKLGRVSIK
jgi:O-antigen/teichoic acid export membrane protein